MERITTQMKQRDTAVSIENESLTNVTGYVVSQQTERDSTYVSRFVRLEFVGSTTIKEQKIDYSFQNISSTVRHMEFSEYRQKIDIFQPFCRRVQAEGGNVWVSEIFS